MTAKQQIGNGGRRPPAHPYYSWTKCLEVGDAVHQAGGNRVLVDKHTIAHAMKMDADSSALSQLISSARCFGIIEGHGSFKLTQAGSGYFLPTLPAESRQAELSFLVAPKAFELLVDRFDGSSLPTAKVIANVLLKDGHVPRSWVDRVAGIFLDAIAQLRLVDGTGRLRYSVASTAALRMNEEQDQQPKEAADEPKEVGLSIEKTSKVQEERPHRRDASINAWDFTEAGGTVRVETPNPLPRALWERLKRYVEILEPPSEGERQ